MEREIGNVVADVGLRAFRYLSFPPAVFETRPRPVAEVAPVVAEPAPSPEAAPAMPAAPPAPALPVAPPSAPARFAEGLPRFGVTSLPTGAPTGPAGSIAGGGLFAPQPAAPSFTAPPPSSPAPAFVMPAARPQAAPTPTPSPAPTLSLPAAPVATQGAAPPWPDPFAPATLPEPPRLRRMVELQGLAPPPPPPRPAGPRSYALLQDVHAELAGRAPPAAARRDPPA